MDPALLYQIALTLLPRIGPVTAKQLISYCGSPKAIFQTSRKRLLKIPGIGPGLAKSILDSNVLTLAEQEMIQLEANNIRPLYFLDPDYPHRLKRYADSPVLLFYKGNADLNAARIVSVVGTRSPSRRGTAFVRQFFDELNLDSLLVISGMAYGIDAATHQACLSNQYPTVGVLGHGLKIIYPYTHREMARQMECHGGLLTEHPFHTKPEKNHFPRRNRIIAGMCDALIVIETGRKGGSMISAQLANSYHKDVFAVPGRPTDEKATGCNFLIKTHQAALLERAEDLLYVMGWEKTAASSAHTAVLFPPLDPVEQKVVDALKTVDQSLIDSLAEQCEMRTGELSALLLNLEFKGVVRALPGKQFTLIR